MAENALMVVDNDGVILETGSVVEQMNNIRSGGANNIVHWLKTDSVQDRIALAKVVMSSENLKDRFLNKSIKVSNVVFQKVNIRVRGQEGVYNEEIRTVLIDDKGVGYGSVAKGVANAMEQIISLVGSPEEWGTEPLTLKVIPVPTANGDTVTLELA